MCNFLTGVFKHSSLSPFCETKMTPLQRNKWGRQTEGQKHSLGIHGTLRASPKAANPQSSTILLQEEAGAAEGRSPGFSHSLSPFMLCHELPADDEMNQITRASSTGTRHISGRLALTKSNFHSSLLNTPQNSQTNMGNIGNCRGLKTSVFGVNSDWIKIGQGATILDIYISVCHFPKLLFLLSIFTVLCPVPPKVPKWIWFSNKILFHHTTRA